MISSLLTEATATARLAALTTVRSIMRTVVFALAALMTAFAMLIYLANAAHRIIAERADPVIADLSLAGFFLVLFLIFLIVLSRPRRRVVVRRPLDEPPPAQPVARSSPGPGTPPAAPAASFRQKINVPRKPLVFGALVTAFAVGFGIARR
ncbi:hypothetical protein [Amorphus orientalis]|uniref:Holin-X, holin superfamily III n=1 Tax=Amorphus orientalis TaxID=649198 RepID=A0AAE3VS11_9HYPH|nr:hypothetical protein [Amorphus orientalis]MDQ0317108.1 hypothetical protein [Amorphus orientalis]